VPVYVYPLQSPYPPFGFWALAMPTYLFLTTDILRDTVGILGITILADRTNGRACATVLCLQSCRRLSVSCVRAKVTIDSL